MAFAATHVVMDGVQAHSVGPLKVEYHTFSTVSGDTSGTITSKNLNNVLHCELIGLSQSALPTYSGKTVTIAFVDPAATTKGQIRLYGK